MNDKIGELLRGKHMTDTSTYYGRVAVVTNEWIGYVSSETGALEFMPAEGELDRYYFFADEASALKHVGDEADESVAA